MPTYKVLEKSFLNGRIYDPERDPGITVEYDGVPGPNLEPIDDSAKKKVAARTSQADELKRMQAAADHENPNLAVKA